MGNQRRKVFRRSSFRVSKRVIIWLIIVISYFLFSIIRAKEPSKKLVPMYTPYRIENSESLFNIGYNTRWRTKAGVEGFLFTRNPHALISSLPKNMYIFEIIAVNKSGFISESNCSLLEILHPLTKYGRVQKENK